MVFSGVMRKSSRVRQHAVRADAIHSLGMARKRAEAQAELVRHFYLTTADCCKKTTWNFFKGQNLAKTTVYRWMSKFDAGSETKWGTSTGRPCTVSTPRNKGRVK